MTRFNTIRTANHDDELLEIIERLSTGFSRVSVESRSGHGSVAPTESIEALADIIKMLIDVTPRNISVSEVRKALLVLDAREKAEYRLARKVERIADPIPFHIGAKNVGANFAHVVNDAHKKVARKIRSLKKSEKMSFADTHFSSIPRSA